MKIAAGIVLMNPEIERLEKNISSVINQVDYLCFIDNNSQNKSDVKKLLSKFHNVSLIELKENKGIAFALNRIVDFAENNSCEWVLTLDQDSICSCDLISEYKKYFTYGSNIAMFTPKIVDLNEDDGLSVDYYGDCEYVKRCITSAALLNVKASRDVGNFDDRMFIDYVDFDLCQNLLNHNYKILRVNTAKLTHEVGSAKKITIFKHIGKLLGIKKLQRTLYTYNHTPLRTYYYARNTFYYIAKYEDTIDVSLEKKVFLRWLILKILFEKNKIAKLKATIKGISDSKALISELHDEQSL
jgi:rhamnosyltransferase